MNGGAHILLFLCLNRRPRVPMDRAQRGLPERLVGPRVGAGGDEGTEVLVFTLLALCCHVVVCLARGSAEG